MTAIGTKYTLQDVSRATDPDGAIAAVGELLSKHCPVLEDMPFIEGNLATGNISVVRSGLPSATWRKLNYGVQPSKSERKQVTDTCGFLENYAECDKRLADLNGNTAAFRLSEAKAFIEGMRQDFESTLWYGDTEQYPERFLGMAPRYAAYDSDVDKIGNKIIKSDGVGGDGATLTSIWLIGWGPDTIHGIYPKGSKAGLQHEDKGQETLKDAAGGLYEGYRDHFVWDLGLCVKDWRYAVRIANIKVSALTKTGSTGSDLIDLMTQALELIESLDDVTPVFYVNRTIRSFLRRMAVNKIASSTLSYDSIGGKPMLSFSEVPVKRSDFILNTESAIS